MPWEKQFDAKDVLDKAMRTFWKHGYEATSMQNLVDCTGINRGSLYATFGDKRTLFLTALRAYDEELCGEMLTELEARYRPRDAIRHLFLAFAKDVPENGGSDGCFLTNTALELASHDREVARIVANAQKEVETFFVRMIKSGKARGEIATHVNPAETARGLLASLIGLAVLSRSRPEKLLLQAVVDDAIRRLG